MESPFTHEYFMKKALMEAEMAYEKNEVPVGAVIVIGDKIIARAQKCTLYVTLEPCQMCAGASYWTQIDQIIFGAFDPKRGFQHYQTTLHPKTKLLGGVMEKECSELINRFFIEKRNLN